MFHDQLLTPSDGKLTQRVPDPEATLKVKRRTISAGYKLRILEENVPYEPV